MVLYNYYISSMFPLLHYLFVTSPCYLFKVTIGSLSVCYVTALFYASTFSSSVSYVTIVSIPSLQCFHCCIICLLRHYTVYTISSRFPLFHYLFVTLLLCSMLRLSLPLLHKSLLYLSKDCLFICFTICNTSPT